MERVGIRDSGLLKLADVRGGLWECSGEDDDGTMRERSLRAGKRWITGMSGRALRLFETPKLLWVAEGIWFSLLDWERPFDDGDHRA